MKISRLTLLATLLAAGLAWATLHTGDYAEVRPAGTATHAGNYIYQVHDSTDTFYVDTFYSDTVVIDTSTSWLNYGYYFASESQADSANDSVVIIINAYTGYDITTAKRLIDADTFGLDANGPDAGDTIWNNIYLDTLILTRLWFETIVKDSFIMGAGVDTSKYAIYYQVLQRD